MKAARYKAVKTENRFLNALQSSMALSLAVHWVFQGMLYMERTERLYKLAIDVVITLLFVAATSLSALTVIIGFLLAHTLNFLFNGQINGLLKCFGVSRADAGSLLGYLDGFAARLQDEPSVRYAAAFGSLSRGELTDTSDVDIRVIRYPGVVHALRSCTFVLLERSRALFTGVPLDIYVLVDLMVAVGDPELHRRFVGRRLLDIIPKGTQIATLDAPLDEVRARRKELGSDPGISQRARIYRLLAAHLNLAVIDGGAPVAVVADRLEKHFRQ